MTNKRAQEILASLKRFGNLDRKDTDEVGWIALRYSCTRAKAEKLIEQAKTLTEPPATATLVDLPGLPGETQAVVVRSVTAATKWLRHGRAVNAVGTYGSLTVWRAHGQWKGLFEKHYANVSQIGCNHLASVVEWMKEWLPKCTQAPAREE